MANDCCWKYISARNKLPLLKIHKTQCVNPSTQTFRTYLLWERYEEDEYDDSLTSNEDCDDVSDKEQLFFEEQYISDPSYSHHNRQQYDHLHPVPALVDNESTVQPAS